MNFFIVDLDGSLSNDTHRRHLVLNKQYDEYHRLCTLDRPNLPVLSLVQSAILSGSTPVVITGRTDTHKFDTLGWLARHGVLVNHLYMRPVNDHRPSKILKKEALARFLRSNSLSSSNCLFAIEDSPEIVDLWRSFNIPVLQIHQTPQ